jgi:hypothetical protein
MEDIVAEAHLDESKFFLSFSSPFQFTHEKKMSEANKKKTTVQIDQAQVESAVKALYAYMDVAKSKVVLFLLLLFL